MLLPTLSLAFLGFAAIVSAGPVPHLVDTLAVREHAQAAERGLVWTPRGLYGRDGKSNGKNNKNSNNNIVIANLVNVQLTQVQVIQEVQITQVVQNIIVIDGRKQARDNVRKNHYRNKNKNVNTVIIIITTIIDNRGGKNNQNKRYLTRQVESNPQAQSKDTVVVSEASTMTVNGQDGPTAVAQAALATGTGVSAAAAPAMGVFDPAAPPADSNATMLLPAGVAAPSWPSVNSEQDPASIIEENQSMFVQFV